VDIRNGPRAKECAKRACELTDWKEPGFLDTLAAAYAECGRFKSAIHWQKKALKLAPEEQKADYDSRLELYRSRRAYRVTPPPKP
jgi:serine/threonine-protein kinase